MHSYLCGAMFFALIFNVLVTVVTSQCSDDQVFLQCSCFVVKNSAKRLTWQAAKEHCSTQHAARLASIKSSTENDELGWYLGNGENWIGLKAEANSSFLLPENATFVPPEVKKTFNTQTCIAINSTDIWEARSCEKEHRYICKQSGSTRCANGWTQSEENSCFWLSDTALNFTAADQECTKKGAKLAEFSTKNEYKFVRKELYNKTDIHVWLGLHKVANATKYTYTSGNSEPNYASLGVKFIKPAGGDSQKYCVTMAIANKRTWAAIQCESMLRSYVCQTEITREFNISVTNVNETSANISWSVVPSECGLPVPRDLRFILSDKRNEKLYSMNLTRSNGWEIVKDLKPNQTYEIKITGNNVVKFQTIEIKNPLSLLKHTSSGHVHAMIGDTVNLLCTAKGEPPLTFWWEKDNRKIPSYLEKAEKYQRSSILSVKLINQTSYGKYICYIRNQFSNITHSIVIDSLPTDDSDEIQKTFVIVTVILGTTVAILLIIIAYLVRYVKRLKQKIVETKKSG